MATRWKNKLLSDLPLLKKGSFYSILDGGSNIVLEDGTKRGLTVKDTRMDEKFNVEADKGMIHDMDGIGHWVGIRWFFPKAEFDLGDVVMRAESLEAKYAKLRDVTCPDI